MLSQIKTSLFDRLIANTALPVLFSNVDTDVPTVPHLRVFVLPANTDTIGINSLGKEMGIFQINVHTLKGSGELQGVTIAEQMLDLFPRNLTLTGVRIDTYGSIAPDIFSDGWHITPVSFQYQHIRG